MVFLLEGRQFNCRTASDAEDVYVTGTFDNWSKSNKLEKTAHGTLEKEVYLPMSEKISYKVLFTRTYVSLPRSAACLSFPLHVFQTTTYISGSTSSTETG